MVARTAYRVERSTSRSQTPRAVTAVDPVWPSSKDLPSSVLVVHGTLAHLNQAAREELQHPHETLDLERALPDLVQWLPTSAPREQRELRSPAFPGRTLGCTAYPAGAPGQYLVFIRDLTDTIRKREQRHRDEQSAALGHMAMGFAHEVRNMLAAVVVLLAALEQEFEASDHRMDYLRRIQRLAGKMAALTTSTLRFGRAPAPMRRKLAMRQVYESVIEDVAVRLAGRSIAYVEDEEDTTVVADLGQLTQVLEILVENALDVAEPAGITVRVVTRANEVEVSVEDNGPGIRPEHLPQVANPFFTTKASGTGLGLSIASRFLTLHDSALRVESTLGQGSRFSFVLPRGTIEVA